MLYFNKKAGVVTFYLKQMEIWGLDTWFNG